MTTRSGECSLIFGRELHLSCYGLLSRRLAVAVLLHQCAVKQSCPMLDSCDLPLVQITTDQ